jgi:hypothetical protein
MARRTFCAMLALVGLCSTTVARAADSAPSASAPVPSAPATNSSPASTPAVVTTIPIVDDPAGAKVLFDQAVELGNAGKFVEACQKLEESRKLHDGTGTAFHLAGCWQKIGRTASAYALFGEVAKRSEAAGQTERADLSRSRMESLAPKLSRLRIDVAERAPHLEVYRDDALVPESDWGKPIAVDRGPHRIRATAEGKEPWSTKLDVSEPATIFAVSVPKLGEPLPKAAVAAGAVAKQEPTPAPKPAPKPVPESGSGRTQRTIAIVLGGVGVAALAAGIFEGAQYLDKNQEAKGICPTGKSCTDSEIQAHQEAVDAARTARTWAYVGIGVGAAALGTATYLFFSAPRGPSRDQRAHAKAFRVEPLVDGRGTWGGVLSGAF